MAEQWNCEKTSDKEELYRRLTQSRRLLAQALDEVTKGRISGLVGELEQQIAEIESRDADAPE
jgi:hypothetical protein